MPQGGRTPKRVALLSPLLLLALAGCQPADASHAGAAATTSSPSVGIAPSSPSQSTSSTSATGSSPVPTKSTALAALLGLPVKGRAPKTGYTRAQFGQAWADVDRNGCDTRNDILRRDLISIVLKAGSNGCLVLRGTLKDPHSGKAISFVRGVGTSEIVQIAHVVALSAAWQKGAQKLSLATRTTLANDPLNLLALNGPTNDAKGDGDAAT